MRNASALSRLVAPMIAVGILVGGCGQNPSPRTAGTTGTADAGATGLYGGTAPVPAGAPGEPMAAGSNGNTRLPQAAAPGNLPAGTVYRNPANGRNEVVVEDIARTAVLIGDSQSEPAYSWPRTALASLGYTVHFCGLGGTGFVASNGKTGNYIDALQRGDWLLPYGSPPLVVIEGGGNDASRGATDEQISTNAERLIASVRQRYPEAQLAMVGTLARGDGRRRGAAHRGRRAAGHCGGPARDSVRGRRGLADALRPHPLNGRRRPHEPRGARGTGRPAGPPAGRLRSPVPRFRTGGALGNPLGRPRLQRQEPASAPGDGHRLRCHSAHFMRIRQLPAAASGVHPGSRGAAPWCNPAAAPRRRRRSNLSPPACPSP